jgi:hypothetical protein
VRHPDGLKPGTLLYIKDHCRRNWNIYMNGPYAVLARPVARHRHSWDALFPSGHRCIFVPMNWEIVSNVR